MALMLAGRFEEALELMEPRKDSANYKDYSMLLTCYANTGRFIEAYHMAEKTLELNSDELAEWIVGIFKALGLVELLHIFPGRNDSFPQSVESPDERYPESDDAREMLQLDPESAQERLNRLDEMIKSASPAERAHAFFTIGELFFAQGIIKPQLPTTYQPLTTIRTLLFIGDMQPMRTNELSRIVRKTLTSLQP